MKVKVEETRCDLPHPDAEEPPLADQHFSFIWRGKRYGADVCETDARELDVRLAPIIEASSEQKGTPRATAPQRRDSKSRRRSKAIRAWAQQQERFTDINPKGRLSATIVREFDALPKAERDRWINAA